MLRYELRMPPGKVDVLAIEDWPEFRFDSGPISRQGVDEQYYLLEGRLSICTDDEEPVVLGSGDWFALDPESVYVIEVLEPAFGHRLHESTD